jgi:topoisomerase-4 subunit B
MPPPPPSEAAPPRSPAAPPRGYSAADIEVLEGLEPVRKRPGMYIGGTDERALHHLFAEVLDNSMDEAVAGFAKTIEVKLDADGYLSVKDDGRGMPVDPHPKHPGKSALEVIMTVLHAGGKFTGKAYETSGGLHGVGASVVNALSERVEVTVWRDGFEHLQVFSRGKPLGPIEQIQPSKKKGTMVRFKPDDEIFGEGVAFKPARLYRMARSKAYLFRGVQIKWSCDPRAHPRPDPARGHLPLPQRPGRLPGRAHQGPGHWSPRQLLGPHRAPGRGRRGRVGRRLDAAAASASTTASCSRTATPSRPPRAAPTRAASAPP